MSSNEDKQNIDSMKEEIRNDLMQEEVRILLGALETIRKEILVTVIDAQNIIMSSVNNQFRIYRGGILARYSFVPTKEEIISEEPLVEPQENVGEEPVIVDEPQPQKQKNDDVQEETFVEVVDEPIPDSNELDPVPESKEDIVPNNMTKRLQELKWFKTKDRDYLIHSVDTLDPDIQAFWINVLGDKQESTTLTFEGFAYQIVVGKENVLWLRRWTEEQIKNQKLNPKTKLSL